MQDFSEALSHGAAHAWLFIPSAILLGALHGLEPGHSKTMMAAFIVAIRGTIWQAVLLGLSAAFSHSLIIWALAFLALRYGSHWNAETTEPYFHLLSGIVIAGLAIWMFWRTRRDVQAAGQHDHDHRHHEHAHEGEHEHQEKDFQDAHEAAHAREIEARFTNREVTTPQIVLFGLTGGLMPCPAAFSVLVVCMQVKHFTLGFALVAAFSLGLAITMVTVGAVAAWSVGHAGKKFQGFGNVMRKAPYFSCALLLVLASYMIWLGWQGLHGLHT